MEVKGPDGKVIYNTRGKEGHRFELLVDEAGSHSLCFTNQASRTHKLYYTAHVGHTWEHTKATKAHLDPAHEYAANLKHRVGEVLEEIRYQKKREQRHRRTMESTDSRMIGYAFLEAVCLIGASLYQGYYLRSLFSKKSARPGV